MPQMWKPIALLVGLVGLFFSIVFFIGLSGDFLGLLPNSTLFGTIFLLLGLAGFIFGGKAINRDAH